MDLIREKLAQVTGVLNELDIDVWMLFGRETAEMGDPSLKLVAPADVVWQTAFIFTRGGERVVIAGALDAEVFRRSGLYSEVIGYHESYAADLQRVLARIDPRQIALNYSVSSHAADGLAYGMYLALLETLESTPYAGRFVSGEEIVARVRGRKSASEVARIRAAVQATELLFDHLTATVQPGWTEQRIAAEIRRYCNERGLPPAWDPQSCPIVNAGPNADTGHAGPTAQPLERGHVLHIDFGVRKDGYCSDLQRLWYARRAGEAKAPRAVLHAFDAVRAALEAGAAALKPGAVGWQVDEAARSTLVRAGYPEYKYALGHQLGRAAHDGSAILGPRWPRYGTTPFGVVEQGNVFTLELGVQTDAGAVSLEEDVLVTAHGCEMLSRPQTEMWYL